jgi:Fic family protein
MPMQAGEVDGVDRQKSAKEYIYDLQINNPQILFNAVESLKYKNRRMILMLLVDAGGNIDVEEIENRTQMAPRTVRNQLQSLEELDLVERTKGHCSTVSFVSKDAEVISNHVIDCWMAQN